MTFFSLLWNGLHSIFTYIVHCIILFSLKQVGLPTRFGGTATIVDLIAAIFATFFTALTSQIPAWPVVGKNVQSGYRGSTKPPP